MAVSNSLIVAAWATWLAYWTATAVNNKTVLRRESAASRAVHILPLALAALLLCAPLPGMGSARLWPANTIIGWAATVITLIGLLFSMWARHYLGTNWSGTVTIKQDHELITSGPYQFVRHLIYTGLIIAFIGTAMAQGELRSLLAPLIATAAFRRKWLHEERWMLETFGAQYIAYKARVPALIPFFRYRHLR